ncbi:MAG: hypothetical protein AMXMBFR84_22070 [Candidatus Hydrogenedentota bacterium]
MRFGKRSRNPLLWGRREQNTAEAQADAVHVPEMDDPPLPSADAPSFQDAPVADNVVPMRESTRQLKEERMNRTAPAGNEPTQRLLTALGRFQRQYLIAQDGAPQDRWSDECMNYLISAVEISIEQGWSDLVESLTETARILQSYEDVGRANQCVPFLTDSYEILCLMVGDLIAGRVRPAVIQRWRARYQEAVEDIRDAGIPLVRDEDSAIEVDVEDGFGNLDAPAPSPGFDITSAVDDVAPPTSASNHDGLSPFELPPMVSESSDSADVEIPSLDDLSPLLMEAPLDNSLASPVLEGLESSTDNLSAGRPFVKQQTPATAPDEEFEMMPLAPMHLDTSPSAIATARASRGLSPSLVGFIDIFCEGLSRMEQEREQIDRDETWNAMRHSLELLAERAHETGRNGALAATRSIRRLCEGAFEYPHHWSDRFFELAYAFGGLYADASDDADDAALLEWISECDGMLAEWQIETPLEQSSPPKPVVVTDDEGDLFELAEQEAYVSMTEPAVSGADSTPFEQTVEISDSTETDFGIPEFEPVPDTYSTPLELAAATIQELHQTQLDEPASYTPPNVDEALDDDRGGESEGASFMRLLETAQAAAAKGSAVDAKLLAMQAAASIARQQAEEAEARVRAAEVRLRESTASIETARERSQISEQSVQVAERRVSEGEESLLQRKAQTAGIQNELESMESRVSDLDAQIRELIAQRESAERQRLAQVSRRDEARAQEDEAQARLERLNEEEQRARVRLEDARQEVKSLQRRRMELEAALERARDLLQRQRGSVTDIEQTIQHIRSAEQNSDTGKDALLF